MAGQVEGDHAVALGGDPLGQRMVHPARHQLTMQENDDVLAVPVFRVLEPAALEGELPYPLRNQHSRAFPHRLDGIEQPGRLAAGPASVTRRPSGRRQRDRRGCSGECACGASARHDRLAP